MGRHGIVTHACVPERHDLRRAGTTHVYSLVLQDLGGLEPGIFDTLDKR